MSTSTGAPAAFARSLGKNDIDERNRRRDRADAADDAGRADEEAPLARVDRGCGGMAGHRLCGRLG